MYLYSNYINLTKEKLQRTRTFFDLKPNKVLQIDQSLYIVQGCHGVTSWQLQTKHYLVMNVASIQYR